MAETVMTPEQIELARHALGLPNPVRRSYRNHFFTGPGTTDHPAWEAMVAAGLAKKRNGGSLSGGDDVFWLTKAAAVKAVKRGERLSSEDFPPDPSDATGERK